ncbi:MAG: hypothetical protein O3A95_08065 [Planctomycetota bacterium]|nr:hypothetical protein [Planctomycetota bacterium]MDA1114237.1 hypothetical protein [Planctomycetota bacterium]
MSAIQANIDGVTITAEVEKHANGTATVLFIAPPGTESVNPIIVGLTLTTPIVSGATEAGCKYRFTPNGTWQEAANGAGVTVIAICTE